MLRKGDIDGHGQLVYNNGSDEAITAAAKFIEWDKPAHAPEGPEIRQGTFLGNSSPLTARPAPEANVTILDDDKIEVAVSPR